MAVVAEVNAYLINLAVVPILLPTAMNYTSTTRQNLCVAVTVVY
nr:hypothetical protein [Anabaena sp. FACHB-1237]